MCYFKVASHSRSLIVCCDVRSLRLLIALTKVVLQDLPADWTSKGEVLLLMKSSQHVCFFEEMYDTIHQFRRSLATLALASASCWSLHPGQWEPRDNVDPD